MLKKAIFAVESSTRGCVRMLSSSTHTRRTTPNKKSVYKEQLTELRKQWTEEHQARIDAEQARRREERRRIVLQKAVRLRERNVVSAQNIVRDRERKAAAMERYRQHVAKNNLVAEQRMQLVQEQYRGLLSDLQEEQQCWLDSPEKVDMMITEDLFKDDEPATTGLHTSSSEHWRHMCVPFNLDVLFNAQFQSRYGPTDASPEARQLEAISQKRLQVREIIESMVGTGRDRQHFQEIVDRYVELYTENDALLEPGDYLDEEEEFIAEMQEESGLSGAEDEERLFQYIEQEISQVSGGNYISGSLDEEEEEEEEDEAVAAEAEEVANELEVKKAARGRRGKSRGLPVDDNDVEEEAVDMTIFDTAEENMSRDFGEDVTGAAAAAAAKKANMLKSQGGKKGAAGKKGKK